MAFRHMGMTWSFQAQLAAQQEEALERRYQAALVSQERMMHSLLEKQQRKPHQAAAISIIISHQWSISAYLIMIISGHDRPARQAALWSTCRH